MPPLKSVAMAPGRDGVDRDPARAEFLRQVACQDLDRPLHGGVSAKTWLGEAGQARRDVRDPPAVVEERQELLHLEKHALFARFRLVL